MNGKGHLSAVTDQAGSASYSYDVLGRLASETRVISGISKTISYDYNLDGSVSALHYPSERTVTYAPDSAGRVTSVTDSNGTPYASSLTYWPNGSEYQWHLPTIYFRTDLNKRLQISGFYSNNGQVGQSFIDKSYSYGAAGQDNGNVISIINNKDATRTQTYTYDSLNRITSGWSAAGTGALSWGENYTIDAWGNLMMSPMSGKAHGGTFQHAGDANNHASGLGYDAAGNLTNYSAPNQYVYDPENRIQSTAGTTYTYDSDGNRVKKTNSSTGTLYWYGMPGIMAESDLSGILKSEYIFVNGKRAARIDLANNSVHYYLSDHLNSTSMVISSAGVVEDEADYSAFGTEYPVTSSGGNHYKFTGKERDTESGLDYFGARYYSNAFGRFLTPDWADKATAVPYANFGDPQTLNLYGYVRNVPTSLVDGDGHGFVNEAFQDWGFDLGVPGWGTGNSQAASAQGGGQQQQQQQGNQNQAAQNNPAVQNLVDAQNGAMANGKYAPNTPTAGTTHCSEAACSIAQRTGMNTTGILSDAKGHNYDANTQINNLANPKNGYHQVTPKEAQALANKGVVVFATQHGTHHGHIVTVRPEGVPGDHPRGRSGPLLANVGLFNGVAHQSAVFNPAHGVITYYAPTH